ncbi:hypothetical protein ES705_15049 [subsurface metagenome]
MNWEELIIKALKGDVDFEKALKEAAEKAPIEIASVLNDFPNNFNEKIQSIEEGSEILYMLYCHDFAFRGEYLYRYPEEKRESILKNSIDAAVDACSIARALGENELEALYLHIAGNSLRKMGKSIDAEHKYVDCMEKYEVLIKSDLKLTNQYVGILNNLGLLYWKIKRYSQAEEIFKKALNHIMPFVEKAPEKYAENFIMLSINLGVLYNETQKYTEAIHYINKAFKKVRLHISKKI